MRTAQGPFPMETTYTFEPAQRLGDVGTGRVDVEGGDTGAQQRRGVDVGEVVRDARQRLGRHGEGASRSRCV